MKLSIQFKNIKEVSSKLEPAALYWPQAKDTLREIGRLGTDALKRSAPRGQTGQLASRLTSKVNDIPRPLWVVFKTDATNTPEHPGGRGGYGARGSAKKWSYPFPYPRRLEYEKTNPHYQWMKRSIQSARPQFRGAINKCAAAIEANWSKT